MPQEKTISSCSSILKIENLSLTKNRAHLLSNISFTVNKGELVALLGPSGAGKSTLIECILGLQSNFTGKVSLHGKPLTNKTLVGYVPQQDFVHRNLTVIQELNYTAELRIPQSTQANREQIIETVLVMVNLESRKHLKISKLSGGQIKRVSLALELMTEPSLLILDEPTSGLDPNLESKMMDLFSTLAKGDRTIMVSTHSMESIMLCQSVLILKEGSLIYYGSPQSALTHFCTSSFVDLFKTLDSSPLAHWLDLYNSNAS